MVVSNRAMRVGTLTLVMLERWKRAQREEYLGNLVWANVAAMHYQIIGKCDLPQYSEFCEKLRNPQKLEKPENAAEAVESEIRAMLLKHLPGKEENENQAI